MRNTRYANDNVHAKGLARKKRSASRVYSFKGPPYSLCDLSYVGVVYNQLFYRPIFPSTMCTNNALFLKVPMSKWVSVCVLPEVHCTFEKHHCHISRDILNLWFDISLRRFVTSYGFEHKLNLNISGTGEGISKQKERKGHSSSP